VEGPANCAAAGAAAAVGAAAIATAAAPAANTGVMWVNFIRMSHSLVIAGLSVVDRPANVFLTLPELLARNVMSSSLAPIDVAPLPGIGHGRNV
jgi:hypothetical protein